MKLKLLAIIFILLSILIPTRFAQAQTSQGPTYIVQPGDTLNEIAIRFGVSVLDLISANGITNANLISAGTPLIIPGLEGISGVLTSKVVNLGDTIQSLSRKYDIPETAFEKLNRLTSPIELYLGSSVIIPSSDTSNSSGLLTISASRTFLDQALLNQANPWNLAISNQTENTWDFLPSDSLSLKTSGDSQVQSVINPLISKIDINPLPISQGNTVVIKVTSTESLVLTGSLNGLELHFFESGQNEYTALQGVHAMAEPGLAEFSMAGTSASDSFSIDQMMLLKAGGFGEDPALFVPSETIDPAVTKPEDDIIKGITSNDTSTKLWSTQWQVPLEMGLDCIKSRYGNRRSYNNSAYIYFHTGVDFGVCAPTLAITAAADGVVVYTGLLTVRGNTTIIDHGWGVFSAYYHQKDIQVKVGDSVKMGQQIGEVGATGRVTGPHLHFEIWVNGIQVQPLDWLYNEYP